MFSQFNMFFMPNHMTVKSQYNMFSIPKLYESKLSNYYENLATENPTADIFKNSAYAAVGRLKGALR